MSTTKSQPAKQSSKTKSNEIDHNAVRRARKAAQQANRNKASGRSSMSDNSYLVGLRVDKVNTFGAELMDRLDGPMSSSSGPANVQLRQALLVYIQAFTSQPETFKSWWNRHNDALNQALGQIANEQLRRYTFGKITEAFKAVLHP